MRLEKINLILESLGTLFTNPEGKTPVPDTINKMSDVASNPFQKPKFKTKQKNDEYFYQLVWI